MYFSILIMQVCLIINGADIVKITDDSENEETLVLWPSLLALYCIILKDHGVLCVKRVNGRHIFVYYWFYCNIIFI